MNENCDGKVLLISDDVKLINGLGQLFNPNRWLIGMQTLKPDNNLTKYISILTPKLIILDLDNPWVGIQGLKNIKNIKPVPFITLSNNADAQFSEIALENGSSCHIHKPFCRSEFMAKYEFLVKAATIAY